LEGTLTWVGALETETVYAVGETWTSGGTAMLVCGAGLALVCVCAGAACVGAERAGEGVPADGLGGAVVVLGVGMAALAVEYGAAGEVAARARARAVGWGALHAAAVVSPRAENSATLDMGVRRVRPVTGVSGSVLARMLRG
jgi:hypothetical protein